MSANDDDVTEVPPWASGAGERMHELDPVLSEAELEILTGYGRTESFYEGTLLWQAGETGALYAVITGAIEVFRHGPDGHETIITHGPGHYPGETSTMANGRALVSGRAAEDLTAVVVEPEELRRLIATESELGEKLLQSFILRRMRMIAENLGNVTLVGDVRSNDAAGLQRFLTRSGVPFDTLDSRLQTDAARARLQAVGETLQAVPVVICNSQVLSNPTYREVAECLGFSAAIDCGVTYDVAVIGSGPAGLASAVYAASEGLSVLVLESCATGGQAGSSSKIENYMGFPTGISGQALMGRAYLQAQKFGAAVAVARELLAIEGGTPWHKLRIDGGDTVYAKSVVIATGAVYRQPALERLDSIGGVHYGASHVEGQLCRGRDIAIVGGGNSAGQAAVYLAKRSKLVHILIRGSDIAASMSDYLVQRIRKLPNVEIHTETQIEELVGASSIEAVLLTSKGGDKSRKLSVTNLFIFIGAQPGTGFVEGALALDADGFVMTGSQLTEQVLKDQDWPLERAPQLLETSMPRIFAAGDVRSGSIKRVASAVGEGSICVQLIHGAIEEANHHEESA